jgi:hypothetical protein
LVPWVANIEHDVAYQVVVQGKCCGS